MESDRASALQRNQQTLGGAASGYLRHPPASDPRNKNSDRTHRQKLARSKTLCHWNEDLCRPNAPTLIDQAPNPAAVELHSLSKGKSELVFEQALRCSGLVELNPLRR